MTELSREGIIRIAKECRFWGAETNSFGVSDKLERFAAAIYEAGIKKGKSIPMKYRRMEFNAKLQNELVIERVISDKLEKALKLAYNQYMGCGGSLSPNEVVLAMQLVIGNAIAEVKALRKVSNDA